MRTLPLGRAERTFWVAGALLAGFCTGIYLETRLFQALENQRLEDALRDSVPPNPVPSTPRPNPPRATGSLVGRLEIPRLKLAVMVLEGSDSGTLRLGAGRVPQTADPGQPGNVVVGGHRDTFFRPLRKIRAGDEITLTTPQGSFAYTVEWTSVVDPHDIAALRPTRARSLTLVTCYPFYYVGPAPQRFIVRARQEGMAAARSNSSSSNSSSKVEVN